MTQPVVPVVIAYDAPRCVVYVARVAGCRGHGLTPTSALAAAVLLVVGRRRYVVGGAEVQRHA